MRRRKLLISIGALGAGGTAAFGTEAFTSVEAERSVDVEIAGDSSAFLAIEPLSGNNANQYVSTEDNDTVALDFDGDDETSGSGVNQDAVTQVEDLFKIINQGTQPTSVFFEDDSDAVTFRVTRSTDTSTEGPNGESLEGADNSVELETGEQVAVGITVDTLNNDVSGSLVDKVTIRADAGASAQEQNIPEPEYVVDGTGDEDEAFDSLSSAFGSTGESIENGAVVGIEGSLDNRENDTIDVDIDDVTVAGFDGTPRIERSGGVGDQSDFITISGDGVTFKNIKIDDTGEKDTSRLSQVNVTGSNVTINGIEINAAAGESEARTGLANIGFDNATNVTVVNCESRSGPIGGPVSGDVTINNNFTTNTFAEGMFADGGTDGSDFTVQRNLVEKHGQDNDDAREIKIKNPSEVNGQTDNEDQIESLLTENNISSAKVAGNVGGIITNQSNPFGTTLQDAVDLAGSDGLILVESGTFSEVSVSDASGPGFTGFTLQGTPTGTAEISGINANGVDGLTVEQVTLTGASNASRTINAPFASDLTVRDTIFEGSSGAQYAVYASDYDGGDFTFENNDISDYPDTSGFASVYIAANEEGQQLDTATVSGNSLTRNDGGIEVFGDGDSTVTMKDNSLISNTSAVGGLGVQDADDVTIKNNEIAQTDEDNKPDTTRNGSGIAVQNSNDVTIDSNDLRNNVIGVFGRNSGLKSSNITSDNTLESNTTTTDIDNNP